MNKPVVAIVGRPNTGKSTFFNRVTGKRISIVHDMEGVTRDRIYSDVEWSSREFTIIDTGGIELNNKEEIWKKIREQIDIAIDLADVIVLFFDGKKGLLKDDFEVVSILRKSGKPIIGVVNKLDNNEVEYVYDFYQLGLDALVGISAEQSKGIGDLLDEIVKYIPKNIDYTEKKNLPLNIAIVGKPNVGKSSITNKILGYDRMIVHNLSGTTRDSIDTPFKYNGKDYNIIDTAGMRKSKKIDESVEYYSVIRTMASIKRADICLIVIDASEEISEQDVRICGYVHDEGKASIIVVNKWDKLNPEEKDTNKFKLKLQQSLKFMDYMDVLFVSAETGQRLNKIMEEVEKVYEESTKRISTGILNDTIREAVLVNEPPFVSGKRLKIFYATQTSIAPPTFVMFTNYSDIVHFSYQRYLENSLRKAFDFKGTPIKLIFRDKNENKI